MTEHENFDDVIAYMTELREAGVLDADWASNKPADTDEKFASGKSIVTIASRETNGQVIPLWKLLPALSWIGLSMLAP